MDPNKTLYPVLFTLPVVETLSLPNRAELLPKIESGEIDHLDFTARTYGTGRNRNPYLFRDEDLPAFAASFEGMPFLRNHDTRDIDARDGTILASRLDGGAFLQEIRLTTRRGMTDFVEGKIDRFSIGWHYDDAICSICNSSFFSSNCTHWPGHKYQTDGGEKICMLIFVNPAGREVSAVNSPAVEGTDVIGAKLADFKLSLLDAGAQIPVTVTADGETLDAIATVVSFEDPGGENQPAAVENATAGSQAAPAEAEGMTEAQVRQASHARQLELVEKRIPNQGAKIMNLRELMAKRAAEIARARELASLADGETRDFTDEERAEYQAKLDSADQLAAQIETIQAERERLTAAEQGLSQLVGEPEKPQPGGVKTMQRASFDKLDALDQAAFIKSGGKLEE
jgi:hypothetical protein